MRLAILAIGAIAASLLLASTRAHASPGLVGPGGLLTCAADDEPGPAAADKNRKKVAAERYRRGQELYAAGEYEASIPEFRAAYCLVPVPEAVFNMGQAYERLVDYERAVVLLEAYVKLLPPSDQEEAATVQHRIKALRRLPARLRVSTEPPGARLQLIGPDGAVTHAMANADVIRLAAGTYRLRVALPGFIAVDEEIQAEIGQPYTYSYRLAPETGTLRVLTNPSDARILVDDRAVGVGSYVDRLPVGQHRVRVEAPDRPTETREVNLDATSEHKIFVGMRPARPPNGKIELLIGSSAFGLVEGGLLGTALFGDTRPLAAVTSAGLGAAGFLVPYFVLPAEVPTGQTSLMVGGRLWGGLEGLTIAATVFPARAFEERGQETAFLTVGGSIGFGVGAGFLARNLDISAGDASLINSGAIWGTTLGLLAFASFASSDSQAGGPLALASLNAGLLVGAILATQTELSRGHVFLIDLGGFAGLVSGTALSALFNDTGVASRYALGGTAIGLLVGTLVTRNVDADARIVPAAGYTTDVAGAGVKLIGLAGTF
jgi:hypothetical protein